MTNKLIEELIIKVKQQGAKPTAKALAEVGENLEAARKSTNTFNQALDRMPKFFQKVEESALRTSKALSKVKLNFSSQAAESSLSNIESALEALVGESLEMNDTMSTMSKNLITLFENLATSLGADLEKVEDGLIDVRAEAGKTNEALGNVAKGAGKAGRGIANQNRQGRNSVRTFSDLAKVAGPLPLLYANIAANVFALSEAFRILTEGEQLNRLEEVGKIVGAQMGAPVQFTAAKMQELTGNTLSYGEALRNAAAAASYGFDSTQIEQLTMAARRASIALGVDMQDAMNRVIRGTSKLEIELLDELGITTKLNIAYEKYAQKLGVSAQALNSYQQRAALVAEINAQSVEKFGDLDEMLRDGAPWEKFGANAATAFQTFAKNLSIATSGMAEFFNDWLFGDRVLKEANLKAQLLGDTLKKAFREGTRSGMVGGLIQVRDMTAQYQQELAEVLIALENPKPGQSIDDLAKRAGSLRSALTRLKIASREYSLGSVKDLDAADTAYKNLTVTVRGSVESYNASIASIKGQAAAYEKLHSDISQMKSAYFELKKADPSLDAAEALRKLGFSSEEALVSAERLAKRYRDTNRELALFSKVSAEAEIQGRWTGKDPNLVKLDLLKQQQNLYTALLVDQRRLGAGEVANAKIAAEIAKINSNILDTDIARVDANAQKLDTQTRLSMAGQPELLIKRDLLFNERARLATLQLIDGTYKEQEQSLNRVKQLQNEITIAQTAQSNTIYQSALSDLVSFAPGVDQLTGSLNNLAMSFNNMGQSSMTSTQMVASGLQAFQGMLQYTSAQAISTIDAQIAAEKKRDGKSQESVAKINALEKKKIATQKKAAKQQILISTAVAVMMAAANPWPMPAIPLMASAALAGGLALSQANSASANVVESTSESAKASLTVGKRDTSIDVSQRATEGELSYLRGESGIGSAQAFTPRANGGIGIPGNSLLVGEDGPEVITPLEPIRVYSNEDSTSSAAATGGRGSPLIGSINALDAQSIIDRSEEIYQALEKAANDRGRSLSNL